MDAIEVETSIAAGEQARQTLLKFVSERAGTRAAHEAETGICTRLLPMGWAARKRYFAPRGTGDRGAAVTRADGMLLPRETPLRARADGARFGTGAGPRTCYRTPGEPGSFPLDAQGNVPEGGDSYVLPEWMPWFEVEQPFQASAGVVEPRCDLEGAASVLMAVAKEAPQDDASC